MASAESYQGTEWQELIRAVEEVQQENQALAEREDRIRERVDKAIERLSLVLDAANGTAEEQA